MKKIIVLFVVFLIIGIRYTHKYETPTVLKRYNAPKPPMQGDRDNPYAAMLFRYKMIVGRKQFLDPLARQRAIDYSKKFLMKKNPNDLTTISSWNALGPGNIGGRIRSILVRPSNANTILIGAVAGGVWKSTDGGSSWAAEMDNDNPIAIDCMANNGDTVYAGTGEGWGNVDAVYGGGIYKSTDFGSTWTLLSSTVGGNVWNFRDVLKLAFDPNGNIYAVTKAYNNKDGVGSYLSNGGLYESRDGGSTWNSISSSMSFSSNYFNGCDAIPITSTTILFATENNGTTLGGIFKTTDGGTTWTQITSGLPSTNYQRIAFAQNPDTANTVYAVIQSTDNSSGGDAGLKGIYKSTDAGSTWSALTKPSNISSTGSLSYLGDQGWYGNVIAVDPNNTANIYVGGVDMMKSTDWGNSWSQLTYWDASYGTPVIHADHHAITFVPGSSGVVYAGDDGGIQKSTDGGASWTSLNNGLAITQFYGGAVYPSGTTYYGGAQDNGHLLYNGSGTSWTEVVGGDGGYAAIDQSNSNVAYEEYTYLQMSKTTDGGITWNTCTTNLSDAGSGSTALFIAPFDIDPETDTVLIAGGQSVWLSTSGANSWSASSGVLSSGQLVSAVTAVNSSSPYLGFAGTTDGKVFKCTSMTGSGDTWTEITPTNNNGAYVRRIVVDLSNKNHVYVCYSGYNNDGVTPTRHIFYSTDQGTSWTDVSGDLPDVPVHSLVIDPNNSSDLYIGTETGVYQSTNGGTNWVNTSTGMPSYVPVDELVRQTGTNSLFAFTHGRSAFNTTAPLPVELTTFASTVSNGEVILNWKTETELNNYGFEIERQTINNNHSVLSANPWQDIGFVKGSGTSNSPKQYSFVDKNPVNGTNFQYRIKQIDNSGKYKYSNAISVEILPTDFSLYQNYPNPFNPTTTIKYSLPVSSKVVLKVYDISGREISTLVNEVKDAGTYEAQFNGSSLASGVYFYRLQAKNYTETKKFVLLK